MVFGAREDNDMSISKNEHSYFANYLIDLAPDAHKPIQVVMDDSRELITPVTKLTQFINMKGL